MRTFFKAVFFSALTAGAAILTLRLLAPSEPPPRRSLSDELSDEQREQLLDELGKYT